MHYHWCVWCAADLQVSQSEFVVGFFQAREGDPSYEPPKELPPTVAESAEEAEAAGPEGVPPGRDEGVHQSAAELQEQREKIATVILTTAEVRSTASQSNPSCAGHDYK